MMPPYNNQEVPQVSVIIPNYNRATLLMETLHSVQQQTMPQWEAIVVDDRSTDHSMEVLSAITGTDTRVRVIRKPNTLARGANASRNIGIEHARGQFIVFLDSDDILSPRSLESRLHAIKTHADADMVIGSQLLMEKEPGDGDVLVNIPTSENCLDRFLRFAGRIDVPWLNTAPLWRTDQIRKSSLRWDETIPCFQDVFFHLEALILGFRPHFIKSEPDCFYRQHAQERVGAQVHDIDRIRFLVGKLTEVQSKLADAGILSETRREAIRRSFFFASVLKSIDAAEFTKAYALVESAIEFDLIDKRISKDWKRFIAWRNLFKASSRMQFWVNRLFRGTRGKSLFLSVPSHYCVHRTSHPAL